MVSKRSNQYKSTGIKVIDVCTTKVDKVLDTFYVCTTKRKFYSKPNNRTEQI